MDEGGISICRRCGDRYCKGDCWVDPFPDFPQTCHVCGRLEYYCTCGADDGGGDKDEGPTPPPPPSPPTKPEPTPKDPCEQAKSLMNDSELDKRIAEYREMCKSYVLEEGYIKRSNGTFQPPEKQEIQNLDFKYSGTYTESMHTHLNNKYIKELDHGVHYFSAGDIYELYKIYSGHHMENVAAFRFIVVADYAAGALYISNPAAFESFGQKYFSSKKGIDEFKKVMNEAIPKRGSVPDVMAFDYAVAGFIRVLQQQNTGLTFLERYLDKEAEDRSWRVKDIFGLLPTEVPCP